MEAPVNHSKRTDQSRIGPHDGEPKAALAPLFSVTNPLPKEAEPESVYALPLAKLSKNTVVPAPLACCSNPLFMTRFCRVMRSPRASGKHSKSISPDCTPAISC